MYSRRDVIAIAITSRREYIHTTTF